MLHYEYRELQYCDALGEVFQDLECLYARLRNVI